MVERETEHTPLEKKEVLHICFSYAWFEINTTETDLLERSNQLTKRSLGHRHEVQQLILKYFIQSPSQSTFTKRQDIQSFLDNKIGYGRISIETLEAEVAFMIRALKDRSQSIHPTKFEQRNQKVAINKLVRKLQAVRQVFQL